MRNSLFTRLALTGIKKNSKLYLPYIISCTGSVMMYYIIDFIGVSPALSEMRGGTSLGAILSAGKFVVAVFSAIFLFYTNSFLIRRRNREFGLYNILGMGKRGISRIIFRESLIVSAVSLGAGLILGILLSKLAELLLMNIIHAEIDYTFSVSFETIKYTIIIYSAIFLLLLVKSLLQVRRNDAIELMKSENVGEKPPKGNIVIAVIGGVLLIAAYLIAVLTKSPLSALFAFIVAVIMVIVATYLLFIAGSVTLCRMLQKDKNYYYKKNHFVSVSSMAYRMKRNGAGLASICILSTMVLVMLASSASLYFGMNDSISSRFPRETQLILFLSGGNGINEETRNEIITTFDGVFEENNVKPENVTDYAYADITALLDGSGLEPDVQQASNNMLSFDKLRYLYFMNESDYNRAMNTDVHLEKGEAMYYPLRCSFDMPELKMGDFSLKMAGKLDDYPVISDATSGIIPSVMFVISDFSDLSALDSLEDFTGMKMLQYRYYYGFDLDMSDSDTIAVSDAVMDSIGDINAVHDEDGGYGYQFDCLAKQLDDFYSTYGGLFFIGVVLSVIFIFAMAMIIYYKQISEGYEDKARFEIMQNVGMTKRDIMKSINSQTLTVFFAPLITAGVHLCFAFPPVWKILRLFNMTNLSFVIIVTVCAFLVFGLFYTALYKITSNAYYSIVSGREER